MGDNLKVGTKLDNKANLWALQRFEPLADKYYITVFTARRK